MTLQRHSTSGRFLARHCVSAPVSASPGQHRARLIRIREERTQVSSTDEIPSKPSELQHRQHARCLHVLSNLLRCDLHIQQLSTQVLNPTTESKRAGKQLIRYLNGTQHTCLRLEPREMVQTGLLELVGLCDSDWAGDSATRQSVTEHHCDVQNVTMCNRSLKRTAISLSSCEAEFYGASACAGELLGLAELFKELHCKVSVRLETDSIQKRIREKRLSVSPVTRRTTQSIFSRNILTDFVQEHLRRNLDYAFWIWLMVVRTGTTDDDN